MSALGSILSYRRLTSTHGQDTHCTALAYIRPRRLLSRNTQDRNMVVRTIVTPTAPPPSLVVTVCVSYDASDSTVAAPVSPRSQSAALQPPASLSSPLVPPVPSPPPPPPLRLSSCPPNKLRPSGEWAICLTGYMLTYAYMTD